MSTWQEIGLQKRGLRDSLIPDAWRIEKKEYPSGSSVLGIPETCGILSAEEVVITSKYDAVDIVRLIKDGKYTAEAVTTAFCKRAAIAQQLVRKPLLISFHSTNDSRSIVSQRYSSLKPSNEHRVSMKHARPIPMHPFVHSMACLSLSRIHSKSQASTPQSAI
jgi:amidase